jgi:hypothetical protein
VGMAMHAMSRTRAPRTRPTRDAPLGAPSTRTRPSARTVVSRAPRRQSAACARKSSSRSARIAALAR